jgi:ribosomal protein L24E
MFDDDNERRNEDRECDVCGTRIGPFEGIESDDDALVFCSGSCARSVGQA